MTDAVPLLGSLCALYECACLLSCVQLLVTPWTVACEAPLSMGFSRQEYWRELPFPTLGDPPDQWIEPVSWVSCIGRWILYYRTACEAPCVLCIAAAEAVHRYQKGLEQSGRITQVTVKQYFST